MEPLVSPTTERRRERRCAGGSSPWKHQAVLRPGQPVVLVNITSCAALVESAGRLRPGAQTELQLGRADARITVRGRLERCYVAALAPIRYRGLLVFERRFELVDDFETRHE